LVAICAPGAPDTNGIESAHGIAASALQSGGARDDDRGTWLEIIHRVVGRGDNWLAGLRQGNPSI